MNGTLVARPARTTMLTPGGDGLHVDVSVSPVAGGQLRRWQAAKAARQPWRRNPRSSQRVHQRSPAGRHAATGWTPSTRPVSATKTPPWWTYFRSAHGPSAIPEHGGRRRQWPITVLTSMALLTGEDPQGAGRRPLRSGGACCSVSHDGGWRQSACRMACSEP
jgi:hypothetical protein